MTRSAFGQAPPAPDDDRRVATPIADPSILALDAWHLLSARTRHCLERRADEANPASTVANVSIEAMHLSDLAKLELKDLARVPNLGRICLCEIAVVMERYGWRFHNPWMLARDSFDHPVFAGLPSLRRKVEQAASRRHAAFERGLGMLDVARQDKLTAREVGERFDVSAAAAQVAMQSARQILDQRARYPLPPAD